MAKRNPNSRDDGEGKKPPAISPNAAEKKRSKGGENGGIDEETMEIEDGEDPRQDLAGKFEALASTPGRAEKVLPTWVYDYKTEQKKPPTHLYLAQPDPVKEKTKGYREADVLPSIHSDKAEVHSLTLLGRSEINLKCNNPVSTPISVAQWKRLFETAFKGTEVVDRKMKFFALRLSKTPPDVFGDLWNNESLTARDDTRAWKAAYNLLGASWFLKKRIQFAEIQNPGTLKSVTATISEQNQADNSSIGSGATTPGFGTTKHGLFVRKQSASANKEFRLNEIPRKYKTIMTARSHKMKFDGGAGDEEAVSTIHVMLDELKKVDPRLVLHPWNTNDKDNRPTTKFQEIKQKVVMAKYMDKLWVKAGEYFYIRFEVGHDVERLMFESDELKATMKNKDCYLSSDQIQDRKVVCAGWFLGSYPKTYNQHEFLPALQAHPLIKGRDLKTRIQDFRLQRSVPYSQKVSAVHLFCKYSEARSLRSALNKIYGSEKSGGLPAGRNMKFIPATTEPSLPPTASMIQKAKIAATKQRRFLACMTHTMVDSIMDMDVYIEHGINATLREIAMCMKTNDGDTNMFVAVDTMWDGRVAFVHHRDYLPDVQAIVPFLPLILEAKFNQHIWVWFLPETKDCNAGFYWDAKAGMVKSTEDDELSAALADFDGYEPFELLEDDQEDETATTMDVDVDAGPPRFNLELQIDLDAPQDSFPIHQMGAGSVGTFRHDLMTPKPASVTTADTTATDTSSLTFDSSSNYNRHQNESMAGHKSSW